MPGTFCANAQSLVDMFLILRRHLNVKQIISKKNHSVNFHQSHDLHDVAELFDRPLSLKLCWWWWWCCVSVFVSGSRGNAELARGREVIMMMQHKHFEQHVYCTKTCTDKTLKQPLWSEKKNICPKKKKEKVESNLFDIFISPPRRESTVSSPLRWCHEPMTHDWKYVKMRKYGQLYPRKTKTHTLWWWLTRNKQTHEEDQWYMQKQNKCSWVRKYSLPSADNTQTHTHHLIVVYIFPRCSLASAVSSWGNHKHQSSETKYKKWGILFLRTRSPPQLTLMNSEKLSLVYLFY